MEDLTKRNCLGRVVAHIHVIEFQKRGLPHAHILLILADEDKPNGTDDYDRFICAELPDPVQEPILHTIVASTMMHGPCGVERPNAPCMVDGKCSKGYPKAFCDTTMESADGYPVYRRRIDGRVA